MGKKPSLVRNRRLRLQNSTLGIEETQPHNNNSILYDPGDEEEEVQAAIDDIVQGGSTEKEEAQIILDSINRKISIREQERAGLIFRGPQLGNALGPDQAACAGPISKNVPSAVDELEWSLLLCGIRSSDLPDITNVSVPRAPVRAKGLSFVTDELERLFLLYNPAASGSTASGSTSTSATSDSLGQPGPAPIATSTASSPGHLSPATTPPLRRHT